LYGVDWDGPIPLETDDSETQSVEVPLTNNPLSEEDYTEMAQIYPPLSDDNNYGISLYCSVLDFVESHV